MDLKKLITGSIAGGVVFFFLGWLIYGMLLSDFMRHNPGQIGLLGRKEMMYPYLVAGQLLHGLLLTYVLLKANVNAVMGGLITGAVVGFLLTAAVDLTMYGTSIIISKKGMAADVLAATVISALAGAVIMAVAGRKN